MGGRKQEAGKPIQVEDHELQAFADVIQANLDNLLTDWRLQVRQLPAAQNLDVPTLNDHIPALVEQLVGALRRGQTESVIDTHLHNSPKIHGHMRLRAGFDIVEVVAEYNILRELLHGLAEEHGIDISGGLARILNRVIDRAIGLAVDTYARERAVEIQQRREEHFSFVMHDLRTPLFAINTAGIALGAALPSDVKTDRVQKMLDILNRNAARLNSLVAAAAREQTNIAEARDGKQAVERREIELWPLVEGLIFDLQPMQTRSVEIVNSVPNDLVVFADALLLTQVFQNLLSNAIRYTPAGQIIVGAENLEGRIRCWVEDTGAGIPAERLGKIFDKLETDPESKGGLGLGLAIVKQLVERHGGQIFVESRVGEGSTFSFTLPQQPERSAE